MKSLLRKCRGENYLFVVNQNHPSISAYFVGESACIGEAVRQKENEDMHVNRVYVFAIYFFKPKFDATNHPFVDIMAVIDRSNF